MGGPLGGLRDVDRLKSRCLGDRAPITLATLWGVSTSPKKEREIQFCVVLHRHDFIYNTAATVHYYKNYELLFNYINNNTLLDTVVPYKV